MIAQTACIACEDCPMFEAYEGDTRSRGWCRLFDKSARGFHEMAQDCRNNLDEVTVILHSRAVDRDPDLGTIQPRFTEQLTIFLPHDEISHQAVVTVLKSYGDRFKDFDLIDWIWPNNPNQEISANEELALMEFDMVTTTLSEFQEKQFQAIRYALPSEWRISESAPASLKKSIPEHSKIWLIDSDSKKGQAWLFFEVVAFCSTDDEWQCEHWGISPIVLADGTETEFPEDLQPWRDSVSDQVNLAIGCDFSIVRELREWYERYAHNR